MRDYYEIFGLAPNASPEQIKERYRFLAQAYHPDKFASEHHRQRAEEQFKEINEAYETLKDSARRRGYDSTRPQNNPSPQTAPPPTRPSPSPSPPRRRPAFAWLIVAATVIACFIFVGHLHKPQPLAEFYAWEKTPQGQYKQLRKNYFMDEESCKVVIGVLNDDTMSMYTKGSTFECWPANVLPSPRLKEFSTYGD